MQLEFTSHSPIEYLDRGSKHAILALHGYGQLARFFAKKFEHLSQYDIWVPQAPNLFYLEGFTGRIGANWLTKENRELGILIQKNMLLALKNSMQNKQYDSVSLCAFSQGVATASRWLMWDVIPIKQSLFFAGELAPESIPVLVKREKNRILMSAGTEDELFSQEKVTKYLNQLSLADLSVNFEWVKGGHSLNIELVKRFFE